MSRTRLRTTEEIVQQSQQELDLYYDLIRCIAWAKQKYRFQDPWVVETIWKRCAKVCESRGFSIAKMNDIELKCRGVWESVEPVRWSEVVTDEILILEVHIS